MLCLLPSAFWHDGSPDLPGLSPLCCWGCSDSCQGQHWASPVIPTGTRHSPDGHVLGVLAPQSRNQVRYVSAEDAVEKR